jgi:hypothetical protein
MGMPVRISWIRRGRVLVIRVLKKKNRYFGAPLKKKKNLRIIHLQGVPKHLHRMLCNLQRVPYNLRGVPVQIS